MWLKINKSVNILDYNGYCTTTEKPNVIDGNFDFNYDCIFWDKWNFYDYLCSDDDPNGEPWRKIYLICG